MSENQRPENLSASDALKRLKEGNQRYCEDKREHPHSDPQRRKELASGQRPFATVLTCADSRVPPELIFDQGLGDLFVIRVAGNIADAPVLGSIEYASLHLGVNSVIVMGHQSCGAVGATVDNVDVDQPTKSNIDSIVDAIRPAVKTAKGEGTDNLLERSVQQNATMVAGQVRDSEAVMSGLAKAGVEIVPAYYSLETGEVTWL